MGSVNSPLQRQRNFVDMNGLQLTSRTTAYRRICQIFKNKEHPKDFYAYFSKVKGPQASSNSISNQVKGRMKLKSRHLVPVCSYLISQRDQFCSQYQTVSILVPLFQVSAADCIFNASQNKTRFLNQQDIYSLFNGVAHGLISLKKANLQPPQLTPHKLIEIDKQWWAILDLDWFLQTQSKPYKEEGRFYMSPRLMKVMLEQVEGRKQPLDYFEEAVFSLGVIALQLCSENLSSGTHKFRSLEVSYQQLQSRLTGLQGRTKRELLGVIRRMVVEQGKQRPSLEELALTRPRD